MIRVLHLVGHKPDFQNTRTAQTLQTRLGSGFSVTSRIIGEDAEYRNLPTIAASIRAERFDVLHLFGDASLLVAAVATGGPILFSPTEFPTRRLIGWLRAVIGYRDLHVLCATSTMQRALVEHGIPLSRCPLVRPGVDFSRIKTQRDESLRAALGFKQTDHVLLAAGESTRSARHTDLVWAASMVHLIDPNQKVLLWGRGPLCGKAQRLGSALKQPQIVRPAEQILDRSIEWEDLLSASDSVIVSASGPVSPLPIVTAMASMRPIVSTVTYSAAELLQDRHTAIMMPRRRPRALAQRIAELREDPQLIIAIADRARAEAYEFFPQSKYLEAMRGLYARLVSGAEPTRAVRSTVALTPTSPDTALRG